MYLSSQHLYCLLIATNTERKIKMTLSSDTAKNFSRPNDSINGKVQMNFKIIDPETWTAFLLGGSPDGSGSDGCLGQAGIT